MKQAGSILVVDDNPDILVAVQLLLKQHYQTVVTTDNPFDIAKTLSEQQIEVILLDMNFNHDAISGQEGFYWLKKILAQDPSVVVVLMTAYGDIKLAVDAIKAGAADFIAKPWINEQLLGVIAAAFSHAKDKQQVGKLTRQTQGLNLALSGHKFDFLGQSSAMQQVFTTIEKAAKTDANILLTGESGTGKELAAHAIHLASNRSSQAFISVDMGAIAQNLFESELFGHKKGAFTDAKADRVGRFELAHGGSLFLDELGNLPISQQTTLLAALQNRQITPVGGTKTLAVDIRLICATNEHLPQAVLENRFRQDLLYRINTVEIRLPPLRERVDDIPLLAKYYLDHFSHKYKRQLSIAVEDMRSLCHYHWPGNVRELAHAIERAVILSDGDVLDIGSVVGQGATPVIGKNNVVKPSKLLTTRADNDDYHSFNLEKLEHSTVRSALKHHQGNVSQAAKALGLTRGAMYRRLEKYGL
ncbi:sigma-54-dependent transcriptional regulator [Colwellia sp. TT2012]|uniref:sigma-54-dependent transcriptional regulator n=1 Tax=Colwellia sp. TT2012 TaxID=1720342 RepID=UPI00070A7889|nr:sigma-54 dependent transcriptional regulator [Colwellia sp. TT2012]